MNNLEAVDKLLKFDGLSIAEKITNTDYKSNEDTVWLGMALQMSNNEKLKTLLNANDDTFFSNTVSDYIRKITSIGFKEIYTEDFIYTPDYGDKNPQQEKMYCFFQYELGILLSFDTFDGERVNSGKFYYNWSPNDLHGRRGNITSSGSFIFGDSHIEYFTSDFKDIINIEGLPEIPKWDYDKVEYSEFESLKKPIEAERDRIFKKYEDGGARVIWVGYHDCREAVKHNILMLSNNGTFVKNWKKCAFSWICNFADFKGEDRGLAHYYELTFKRLEKFPKDVLLQIGSYRDTVLS